jgi:hypothetical protein
MVSRLPICFVDPIENETNAAGLAEDRRNSAVLCFRTIRNGRFTRKNGLLARCGLATFEAI